MASANLPSNIVVVNCNDSGPGSLRAAVTSAISDDAIDLTQLDCSKISLTTGELRIGQSNLNIVGPGQNKLAIDAGNTSAVLYHVGDGTLMVSGLSILNGTQYSRSSSASGACVHANRSLRLENVTISHCTSFVRGNNAALGGAVSAYDYAAIIRSTISDSGAVAIDTGVASGGGVFVDGNLYMRGSTITNNSASSPVPSYGSAGGLFARGIVNMSESLIAANHADSYGGMFLRGSATITNSTVSGNTAALIGGIASTATLNLYNDTIAFNHSSVWTNGGSRHYAAGVHGSSGGILSSTIIANNTNSAAPHATADLTAVAPFSGESNNIMFSEGGVPVDTTIEDPGLRPLQDHGGPTKTHAPTPGSWDRFHGTNRRGAVWDQRGVGFSRMSLPDPIEIGAFQTNSGIIFVNGFN